MIGFWIVLGLLVLVGIWAVGIYNTLVQLRENVKNGWSQIDVQLKRRHDLIPNLIEVAKGYMAHEKNTLENVVKARQQAINADNIKDRQLAENLLTQSLRSLFAVAENYPNLKADTQMSKLQEELASTENRIASSRQYYNDGVNRLNTTIQSFPDNVVANMFHFEKRDFFQIDNPQERAVPQVKF
jgi:LemA protein